MSAPVPPVLATGQAFDVGPGMRLSEAFFVEHVAPLADVRLGRSRYAAGLLGHGSEVLGLDTELSFDHDWGPRVVLFVDGDARADAASIQADLPDQFRGVSRLFGAAAGGRGPQPFEVVTVAGYFNAWIGFANSADATLLEWLSRPAMSFLAVTAGAVFHDGPGALTAARATAHWYPEDVWRWLIACQWRRVGEEQPFIERAAVVGDQLGAELVVARIARDLIRLAFLLERRYAPYSKWLGSAFATLPCAAKLAPLLTDALAAQGSDGNRALCGAAEQLGALTNARLGLDVDPSPHQYFTRPIQVAPADTFTEAALASITTNSELRAIPTDVGNVDMLFGINNGGAPGAREAFQAILGRR